MKPGGSFLCQAITTIKERAHKDLAERFIADYVFPDGELASFPKLTEEAENAGWKVTDAESWRPHYAKTLRAWVANLESAQETAQRLVGYRHTRLWTLYMIGCALAYEASRLDVHQLVLKQADDSKVTDAGD
jgi:cyclopropane-fatty-acyl-phospholipid synthase